MSSVFTQEHIQYIIEQAAIFVLAFLLLFTVIVLPLALLSYIFSSVGYSRMAKKFEIKSRWLVWLPLVRCWITGAIADRFDRKSSHDKRLRIVLLCASLGRLLGWGLGIFIMVTGFMNIAGIYGIDTGTWDAIAEGIGIWDPTIVLPMIMMYISMAILYAAYFDFAFIGVRIIAVHKIFEPLRPRVCLLHSILGMIIPLYRSICIMNFSKSMSQTDSAAIIQPMTETVSLGWYDQ